MKPDVIDSPTKGKHKPTAYTSYRVTNEGQPPFTFTTKAGGRVYDSLEALCRGPLNCPSKRRVSDHILRLRKAGILIETEMKEQKEHGNEKYGVYHLQSEVTRLPPAPKTP